MNPRKKREGLFKGEIWIDTDTALPVREVGRFVKSPSVFLKKVDFTLTYDYAVLGNGAVPDSVKRIKIPTLVLDGEKTLPFIRPAADRIADLIPQSQRQTIPGQSHQAAPEVIAPLLVEFFSEPANSARLKAMSSR